MFESSSIGEIFSSLASVGPKCDNEKTLSYGCNYIKEYRNCEQKDYYNPSQINKKVFYIDQFAISNMMKSINEETKAFKENRIDSIWICLYEKLHLLTKAQLIVCPDSMIHYDESLVSPFNSELKLMMKLLSGGVSFKDSSWIYRTQIFENQEAWLLKQQYTPQNNVREVIRGNIDAWQEEYIIDVELNYEEDWIKMIREYRESVCSSLGGLSDYWKTLKNVSFEEIFEHEIRSYGHTLIMEFCRYQEKYPYMLNRIVDEDLNTTIEDLLPSPAVQLVNDIKERFIQLGVKNDVVLTTVFEYLKSDYIKKIPAVFISSLLYASLARKFVSGKKKPPNRGLKNDFDAISLFAPYCEAMLLDGECYNY